MPSLTNGRSRSTEDAFDWFRGALGSVLGVPAARLPLRRDRPLSHASDEEIAGLTRQMQARLPRREDPVTGVAEFKFVEAPLLLERDRASDERVVAVARDLLPPIRAAIERIEFVGIGEDPDDLRSLKETALKLLGFFEDELTDPGSHSLRTRIGQIDRVFMHFWTAIGFDDADSFKSVHHERQRSTLQLAQNHWTSIRSNLRKTKGAGALSDVFGHVENRASSISDQAEIVLDVLEELGVSSSGIESVVLNSGERLLDLLVESSNEPKLWLSLAHHGREPQRDIVRKGVHDLRRLARPFDEQADCVADDLALGGEGRDRFIECLRRLVHLVETFANHRALAAGQSRKAQNRSGGSRDAGPGQAAKSASRSTDGDRPARKRRKRSRGLWRAGGTSGDTPAQSARQQSTSGAGASGPGQAPAGAASQPTGGSGATGPGQAPAGAASQPTGGAGASGPAQTPAQSARQQPTGGGGAGGPGQAPARAASQPTGAGGTEAAAAGPAAQTGAGAAADSPPETAGVNASVGTDTRSAKGKGKPKTMKDGVHDENG